MKMNEKNEQIQEIKQIETKEPTLEDQLQDAKKERNWDLLKTIGGAALSVVTVGGIALLCSVFDNNDVRNLVAIGSGVTIGSVFGGDYVELMRELIDDLRYSYQRVGYLKRHANEYNAQTGEQR